MRQKGESGMKGELDIDPRGLIHEAYRIEGIGPEDCRTIFFDWAVGLPEGATPAHLRRLIAHYGPSHPDHPMTAVLNEGLSRSAEPPKRRGGRKARPR
jgi:hypothetical protein